MKAHFSSGCEGYLECRTASLTQAGSSSLSEPFISLTACYDTRSGLCLVPQAMLHNAETLHLHYNTTTGPQTLVTVQPYYLTVIGYLGPWPEDLLAAARLGPLSNEQGRDAPFQLKDRCCVCQPISCDSAQSAYCLDSKQQSFQLLT